MSRQARETVEAVYRTESRRVLATLIRLLGDWASRCPASENEVIEIRQVQEFSDFPADVQDVLSGLPEMQAQARGKK